MDIYLEKPEEMGITLEQFKKFTVYELSSFFINFRLCFNYNNDDSIRLCTSDYDVVDICMKNKRFNGVDWYEKERVELYYCDIEDGYLKSLVENRFKWYFLK